jgi:hypothetical protein
MTALDLVHTLVTRGALPTSRVKDFRTSLQKLADACHVSLDDLDLPAIAPTYDATLTTYFAELSPPASVHTQRNTRANLRQLYRALATNHLLAGTVPPGTRRRNREALVKAGNKISPYRHRTSAVLSRYVIPDTQWPVSIRDGWERYRLRRAFELRPVTLGIHRRAVDVYVSFGLGIDQPPLSTWDELFDPARLMRFVTWHAARVGAQRITHTGAMAVQFLTLIAKYDNHPGYAELKALTRKLPAVSPFHNKQSPLHTISARELEDVGLTLLKESHEPLSVHSQHLITRAQGRHAPKYPRLARAITHQTALMLRLMWRLPLRSRSVREMQLGRNLIQHADGVWHLRYIGDELKVGQRGGRINRFEVPWPPDLVSHLEEYLHDFRPCFPHAADDAHVFLAKNGKPLLHPVLWKRLRDVVYVHLQKRLYPHLLRTLWVDQYLLASNGDVSTAAYLLNDNVATVLRRYHELRGADHIQKAYAFNQAILGHGKRHRHGT